MASSRKSSRSSHGPRDLATRVAAHLGKFVTPADRLVVGLSGGVDSVVLLDCLRRASRSMRYCLSAVHVNHQLSANARRWSGFCRRLCAAWRVPFRSIRVEIRRGNSIEAAAREARYAAFARQDCDYVVVAHHRDDQAETLLLQLLRGTGVKGLAGMRMLRREERSERGEAQKRVRVAQGASPPASQLPPAILRPMLDVTREEILDYANMRGLKWVEDESNCDTRLARNFLRHDVFPVIARRFPAYREALARAAGHLAEAADMLGGLAAHDGLGQSEGGGLAVEALRRLPPARAKNLLRYFLAGHGVKLPGVERLKEALRQALGAKRDARVQVDLGKFVLHRYRDRLHVVRRLPGVRGETAWRWQGQRALALPELGGVLAMTPSRGQGVSLARLRGGGVTIRVRRSGERLQPDCRRPRRSLKNLLQEEHIPPWQRDRLPMIFCGEELVWVAGVGVDCKYQAAGVEPAIQPAWHAGAVTRRLPTPASAQVVS